MSLADILRIKFLRIVNTINNSLQVPIVKLQKIGIANLPVNSISLEWVEFMKLLFSVSYIPISFGY
jgi:hypothetical protein